MNPIDKITDRDRELIAEYISAYATPPSGPAGFCGVDHYLRFWNEEKAKHLFKLFGEQLSISIPVEWEATEDELRANVSSIMYDTGKTERAVRCYAFRETLINKVGLHSHDRDVLWEMMSSRTLARNRWSSWRSGYTFNLPDGSSYTIHEGIKPMKVIRKLASAYGVEGFEEFCNAHSLCLNQKRIKGSLTLSIHPMDYMTMSDNHSCWETCMSWTDNGQYKQGTVEMMNSPCAVVGFLASDEDWEFAWRNGQTYTWNNKKWRSLFLIDEDFVLNVKEYPYRNDTLVQNCLRQLADLKGWHGAEVRPFRADARNSYNDGTAVCIRPDTGAMYNDFGDHHFIVLNSDIVGGYYDKYICYSGKSMCVWCGGTHDVGEEGEEYALCCSSCDPRRYCAECGCVLPENDDYVYWLGDDMYCECCHNSLTEWDPIQEEYIHVDDCITLHLNPGYEAAEIARRYYDLATINIQEDVWDFRSTLWNRLYKIDAPHCIENMYGSPIYYVNVEDIKNLGDVRRHFGYWDDEDFEQYIEAHGFDPY